MENHHFGNSSKKIKYSDKAGWISPSFETSGSVTETRKGSKRSYSRVSKKSTNCYSYRKHSVTGSSNDNTWAALFSPQTKEDLAVHKKKICEVEEWLVQSFKFFRAGVVQRSSFLLLLTGPAGAGKTATVKVLAKELNANINEWSSAPNEISSNALFADENQKQYYKAADGVTRNQTTIFRDFFIRANKYLSLLSSDSKRLILVEEYPNVFLKDPLQFHNIIRMYHKTARCPAVFIVSDSTSGESLENKLFPKDLQLELNVTNISFNPVAPTMLIKVIDGICKLHGSSLSKEEVEGIASDSMGDIRNAINTLQFFSTGSGSSISLSQSPLSAKEKMTKSYSQKHEANRSAKDTSLFLFHALGKVLYSKRDTTKPLDTDNLPIHLKEMGRHPLISSPEEVFGKTTISAEGFSLFLHENCLSFVDDVDTAVNFLQSFSQADALCSEWTGRDVLNEYAASLVSRSIMFSATSSKSRGWCPLRKPQHYSCMKNYRSSCSSLRYAFKERGLNLKELQTELVPYLSKIDVNLQNSEQTKAVKQFGQMTVKKFYRPHFESLNAKDVIKDESNSIIEDLPLCSKATDATNCYAASSDEEILIEDYDDE